MTSGPCGLPDSRSGAPIFLAWRRWGFCRGCGIAGRGRETPASESVQYSAASAWAALPIAPAAVRTAIRQSLPATAAPYPPTRVILESSARSLFSVACLLYTSDAADDLLCVDL